MGIIKNKKGSIFLGLALGIFIFVNGVLIMVYFFDDITTTRVALDCADTSISGGNKITCLFVSAGNPYFIWLFTSLSIGLIIGSFRE